MGDGVSDKYHHLYEGQLDPFKRFGRQEESRRLAAMNPADRAALSITKFIIHNKYSRWIFLAYSACLHLLVFATLVLMSTHHDACTGGYLVGVVCPLPPSFCRVVVSSPAPLHLFLTTSTHPLTTTHIGLHFSPGSTGGKLAYVHRVSSPPSAGAAATAKS